MSTETNANAAASAAAKPQLIMYLQGPYERFPSCVHRVDGELVATFRWERGWIYADPARAANIFQRALAVTLLQAGDIVRGWTKNGWQFGEYVEGNGKSHIFRTADGITYSTEVAEPHAFKRGDEVLAKIDGQWLPCVYQKYQDGQYFVHLAPSSGSLPTEWQVSHLAFPPQCRQPILRS